MCRIDTILTVPTKPLFAHFLSLLVILRSKIIRKYQDHHHANQQTQLLVVYAYEHINVLSEACCVHTHFFLLCKILNLTVTRYSSH